MERPKRQKCLPQKYVDKEETGVTKDEPSRQERSRPSSQVEVAKLKVEIKFLQDECTFLKEQVDKLSSVPDMAAGPSGWRGAEDSACCSLIQEKKEKDKKKIKKNKKYFFFSKRNV
ncbi:hypothetical protein AMEX_G14224 [Astyanax mexicanus]|uniref:Uncharacterized protein n=1 Tax=Astyanax mexicanus TaxID=7994 RepID=A0A8T2LKF7_ASTMX|nr:hypothetical protein AMEX_G14224 [Astyanax mexicanus]